ncbi:sterol carrier family protein [Actinomyces urogenitalis]
MAARRRIDTSAGAQAVRQWAVAQDEAESAAEVSPSSGQAAQGHGSLAARSAQRRVTATAVRFSLEELAACAPGHSVEVRVPPFGATQAVAGTVHRRGTPPSVVETDAQTWLRLATGRLDWEEALASGALHASGERCDLSPYLPLMRA